ANIRPGRPATVLQRSSGHPSIRGPAVKDSPVPPRSPPRPVRPRVSLPARGRPLALAAVIVLGGTDPAGPTTPRRIRGNPARRRGIDAAQGDPFAQARRRPGTATKAARSRKSATGPAAATKV